MKTLDYLKLPGAWTRPLLYRNAAEADSGAAAGGSPAGQTQNDAAGADGKTTDGDAGSAPAAPILGGAKPDAGETSASGDTGEKKEGEGDAPKDGEGDPADTVPEDGVYTLELPEGMEVDEELSAAAFPVFKELGLTNAQASKLAGVYAEFATKQAEATQSEWVKLNESWAKAARADKELQGEGFDTAVAIADKALQKLGSPELIADVAKYGWGNHPEFIRFAYRAGKLIADDTTVTGDGAGADATPAEERLYGKTTPTSKKG